MPLDNESTPVSKKILWAGRSMSGLPALFLLFGGVMDLIGALLWGGLVLRDPRLRADSVAKLFSARPGMTHSHDPNA